MMSIDKYENINLSVVMPVYNEAGTIESTIRDFYNTVGLKIPDVEFIIAEDGSTDGTRRILKRLAKELPIVLICSRERKGYTKAFKDALAYAKKDLILFSDSDGQHKPSDVFLLLEAIKDNDIASGYKMPRMDPLHRIVMSKVYNFIINILFKFQMIDIDSGFKLIRREVIEDVLWKVTRMEYCVMSEFIIRSKLAGYRIVEVPVSHISRTNSKTCIFLPTKLLVIIFSLLVSLLIMRLGDTR
ncbi:glycosyltransferase family 2 protein [Candidatus Omnitrophota bacterium]